MKRRLGTACGRCAGDRRRPPALIFTCCHPSLSEEARIALTLREVCGLTTEAIASRLPGGHADAGAAHRARQGQDRGGPHPLRSAGAGGAPRAPGQRAARGLPGLQRRPSRAGRKAWPTKPSAWRACCANCCPSPRCRACWPAAAARCAARRAPQPPATWCRWKRKTDRAVEPRGHHRRLRAGRRRVVAARLWRLCAAGRDRRVHGEAASAAATDWPQIVGLYDALLRLEPSPVIALNRAVAVAMRDGPEAGLALIEAAACRCCPATTAAPAALADLCRRAGRLSEAATHYRAPLRWPSMSPSAVSCWGSGCAEARLMRSLFRAACRKPRPPFDQGIPRTALARSVTRTGDPMPTTLTPYLSFGGNTREAFDFYAQALGARDRGHDALRRHAAPAAPGPTAALTARAWPDGAGDGIMHACLRLPGGAMLLAGDVPPGMPFDGMKGVMLALQYDTVARPRQVFAALLPRAARSPCRWRPRSGPAPSAC
jgi:uncharacterized glyoxalase superfamily protein PhnB